MHYNNLNLCHGSSRQDLANTLPKAYSVPHSLAMTSHNHRISVLQKY